MTKVFRFVAICVIGVALTVFSIASAQTYTTIDSIFTFVGGSNPEGDSVGEYIDTAGVAHSFLLSNGVFTSFDPPGTGPNGSDATGINPGGVIVGLFADGSGAVHGFIRIP